MFWYRLCCTTNNFGTTNLRHCGFITGFEYFNYELELVFKTEFVTNVLCSTVGCFLNSIKISIPQSSKLLLVGEVERFYTSLLFK